MDLSTLDEAVRLYCYRGLAESTHRTYRSGLSRYMSFCDAVNVSPPFPVSETILCYFVTYLARQGTSPASIKTYLAAVRHAQIVQGHPEPRQSSSLPRLRLVQNGIQRERASSGTMLPIRLPVTISILRQVRPYCLASPPDHDSVMMWAAATTCFFGFFRAGELTVPSVAAFDPAVHLAWGDVSVSDSRPHMIRVFLKRSKTDQFGRGVSIFLGPTGDDLCPVSAVLAYVAIRGNSPGAFFQSADGLPLTKAKFVARFRAVLVRAGVSTIGYSGHSFRIGAATAASRAGIGWIPQIQNYLDEQSLVSGA